MTWSYNNKKSIKCRAIVEKKNWQILIVKKKS